MSFRELWAVMNVGIGAACVAYAVDELTGNKRVARSLGAAIVFLYFAWRATR